ncbi:MAG: glycosyltransferase family 2 protein [Melioribacteraceae bacterium]|nr:glycosyltransferase family 2 protein [Melioribacteraceae bacterium]MCF8265933.1 glycosyltransferase family 2 protein [Melioribacteraceae bacterium]MCF8297953.1 glycosyltransferase family 2 protein [Saprospiraceae bacterium]
MHNTPKVIVIILSYNGKELLDEAVSSYQSNNYPNFEIIVLDNGSIDDTYSWMGQNFPEIEVLRTEINLGYSGGLNFGMNYAFSERSAEYVLITNNDVRADINVISSLVETATSFSDCGFVIGKVYYYDNPKILQTVGKKSDPIRWNGGHIGNREFDNGQYETIETRDWCDDIYWLVKKELYEKTGGYDTTFFLQSEDYDWQARAKKIGFRIYYTPNARLWHKDSFTIGQQSAIKYYYNVRNPMIVILKHREPKYFKKYFWLHFRKDVILTSIKILIKSGEIKKSYFIWKGFLSGVRWGFKNKLFSVRHFI